MLATLITGGAVYIPGCAVSHPKGLRRVCGADEDAVTMAVEAGLAALQAWGGRPQSVDTLVVALHQSEASPDFGVNAHILREAFGFSECVRTVVLSGADELSGVEALHIAGATPSLVIAADEGTGCASWAGAAALILEPDADASRGVTWQEVSRASALTHRRWTGSDNGQELDLRYLAHRDRQLFERLSADTAERLGDIAQLHVVVGPGTRLPWTALLGLERLDAPTETVGMGVTGSLVAIVHTALHPAPTGMTAVCAIGSGRAVLLKINSDAVDSGRFAWSQTSETTPPAVAQRLGPELSFPLESPFYSRNWGFTLRLEAARCVGCGHVAFPPAQRPVCPKCHSRTWSATLLPRDGKVFACLENKFLPGGFPASLVFVLGELSNGAKYWAPMSPEVRGDEVKIGDPVRLTLRRFTARDGIAAYAMKFIKLTAVGAGKDAGALAP
jgi:hydroxymethylglutaryl-CoA synthase